MLTITSTFIAARGQQGQLCNITVDIPQHPAMIATGAMLVILITSLFMKGWKYEAFYVIHVIMSVLVVFGTALHRPDVSTYSVRAMIFTAAIFVADRIIRGARLILNSRQQTATLTPLAGGGTMITLSRPIPKAVPGRHVLLMIGKIKFLQSHPFTIVSTEPQVKFILDSYSGFTQKLHELALKEPGVALPATFDGPYGTLPPFHRYNKVILIAGGTGASFTFSVALELLKRLKPTDNTSIEFIWTLRDQAKLEWFTEELAQIAASPLINLAIHTTSNTFSILATKETTSTSSDVELGVLPSPEVPVPVSVSVSSSKIAAMQIPAGSISTGRPNIPSMISSIVKNVKLDERVVVAACGPEGLVNVARNATARCVRAGGRSVELHVEQFGW